MGGIGRARKQVDEFVAPNSVTQEPEGRGGGTVNKQITKVDNLEGYNWMKIRAKKNKNVSSSWKEKAVEFWGG